jgi:hypothetical protein
MKSTVPIIWSSPSSAISTLKEGINTVLDQQAKTLIIMASSENNYDENDVRKIVEHCPVPICGGLFPKLVDNHKIMSSGLIVIGLDFEATICNYSNISTADTDSIIGSNSQDIFALDSFIIFADALCNTNEDFIDQFYDHIGSGITVIGGGAGFLDFVPRPCIFTNEGLINDAVQIVGLPKPLSRSIGHGWEVFDGPYLVTASCGHNIHTIDYQPAFELYRNTIQHLCGENITENNFFEAAKDYPLGIVDLSGNVLVRDPITTDGSSLECVGNVPTNVTVNILRGDQDKLIQSAEKTASELTGTDNSQALMLFDCISRILYLEDRFSQEIDALKTANKDLPMFGALSLGEITNAQSSAIHLLNKSTVIGTF